MGFSTPQTSPWATIDDLADDQVSAQAQFRGDSQGVIEADQELWLYVFPLGATHPNEANYALSPLEVNENNGHWVAMNVEIGHKEQGLGQRFEIGLLIAPADALQRRTFELGELPGTVQTARTFVVRQ